MKKHRWKKTGRRPYGGVHGAKPRRECLDCGVRVWTAYGGLCYLWPGEKEEEQSGCSRMTDCPNEEALTPTGRRCLGRNGCNSRTCPWDTSRRRRS